LTSSNFSGRIIALIIFMDFTTRVYDRTIAVSR